MGSSCLGKNGAEAVESYAEGGEVDFRSGVDSHNQRSDGACLESEVTHVPETVMLAVARVRASNEQSLSLTGCRPLV
jgi:hypothetical protein